MQCMNCLKMEIDKRIIRKLIEALEDLKKSVKVDSQSKSLESGIVEEGSNDNKIDSSVKQEELKEDKADSSVKQKEVKDDEEKKEPNNPIENKDKE